MKRVLAFLLVLFWILAMTACGRAPADSADGTPDSTRQTIPTTGTKPTKPEDTVPTTATTLPDETEPTVIPAETTYPTQPEETTTPVEPTTPTAPTQPPVTDTPHAHSYTGTVTKAAGCLEKGTKTYRCSCGSSYTEDIAATGHSWGDWVTTKAPTTTEAGNSQRNCKNCSATENQAIAKLPAPVPEGGAVTQDQLAQIYDLFLTYVNAERTRVGVAPLTANSYLDSVAQIRSKETVELFSHTRPNGEAWVTVLDTNSYPYTIAGENLCMTSHVGDGAYTAADKWVGSMAQIEAAAGWLFTLLKNSPGHYANMIHQDYTECGIGISCQLYGSTDIPMFYLAHIFADR